MECKLSCIAIVGSHGIPANYGGFETFAEEISLSLVRNYGFKVTVVCDSEQYYLNNGLTELQGVKLRYSRYSKSKNAIRFYYDSISRVIGDHDIVYSCGPAGGLFGWLVHSHGKILITNPDGLNSQRSKWSYPIKVGFRMLERAACYFSDRLVCDSAAIENHFFQKYRCLHTDVVEYGAFINPYIKSDASIAPVVAKVLGDLELIASKYHLVVSRLEPENNLEMIIRGYQANEREWPLIIVGDIKNTGYVKLLKKIAHTQVRFVGGIYEKEKLSILRANAASYIHGHSVGGTNPSLLEAMGSRNLCICHDNPFNREVVKNNGLFFTDANDIDVYLSRIEKTPEVFENHRDGVLDRVNGYYSWNNMAEKCHNIFMRAFENISK